MKDAWGREIDYMRVSITDRCNLRCRYCMPESGLEMKCHEDILSYEEMLDILSVAVSLGFRHFRVTGGEPLVRRNVVSFLERLSRIPGVDDLSLTTNGVLLFDMAKDLKKAGVHRVNISLDTLRPARFAEITRGGDWRRVWMGLERALEVGFDPVKINVVAARGINDDEWEDFARLTLDMPVHVRFIEIMPLGQGESWVDRFVSAGEVLARLMRMGEIQPVHVAGGGPARYVRLKGAKGSIGVISAISQHFCSDCNRMRLTADGKLSPCLASGEEVDLLSALRGGAGPEELGALFEKAVLIKPARHTMEPCKKGEGMVSERKMYRLGG
ncbi:MAG: GTP 3',8-cyclase MoaA [Bacillota bacterium]